MCWFVDNSSQTPRQARVNWLEFDSDFPSVVVIYVQDAKKSRVAQWRNVSLNNGKFDRVT